MDQQLTNMEIQLHFKKSRSMFAGPGKKKKAQFLMCSIYLVLCQWFIYIQASQLYQLVAQHSIRNILRHLGTTMYMTSQLGKPGQAIWAYIVIHSIVHIVGTILAKLKLSFQVREKINNAMVSATGSSEKYHDS